MRTKRSTIEDLKAKGRELQITLEDTQRALDAINLSIEIFEEDLSRNGATPQIGSFTAAVIVTAEEMLRSNGPMHRKDILKGLTERGLYFENNKSPINTVSSYLSMAETIKTIGAGMWDLTDEAKEGLNASDEQQD